MPKLPSEFKKISLVIIIIFSLLLIAWVTITKIALVFKLVLGVIIFSFFLSSLLVFEAINSFWENLFFWLVVAVISSFFYLPAGLIVFLVMMFKISEKNYVYQSRLKFPFFELALKDYTYLLLSLVIIANLFIYQNLIRSVNLPLSFASYSFWLENFNYIFRLNLPLNEKASSFLENYLKSYQDKKELLALLPMVKLPEITIKEIGYNSLKNGWQNPQIKWWYIMTVLLIIDTILYPLFLLLGRLIGVFVLIFVNLLKLFHLFQIEYKSVNKEIITI